MFVGMTFCLPLAYYYEHRAKQQQLEDQQNESTEPLLNSNGLQSLPSPPHTGGNTWKEVFMLAIPTFFDRKPLYQSHHETDIGLISIFFNRFLQYQ